MDLRTGRERGVTECRIVEFLDGTVWQQMLVGAV